jgi:hypothetical protein
MPETTYQAPPGSKIEVSEDVSGNTRVVRMKMLRPDGSVELEMVDTRPLWQDWMNET